MKLKQEKPIQIKNLKIHTRNIPRDNSGCSPFIATRVLNRFHHSVLFSENLLSLGYVCTCANRWLKVNEMINTSFRLLMENVIYEPMYAHKLFD